MTILVLLYIVIGLISAATHYLMHPNEFTNENLQERFSTDIFHETRVVLAIVVDIMTWPVVLFLKLREKKND